MGREQVSGGMLPSTSPATAPKDDPMSYWHIPGYLALEAETKTPGCGLTFLWVCLFEHSYSKASGSLPVFSMIPIRCSTFSDVTLLWRFMTIFLPWGLRDVEQVYRIETPQHMNGVRLEVEGTKLDLPIFRRPKRPVNEHRNPMTIGLLRCLCGEAGDDAVTQYHDDEPCAGSPSASNFVTGHGEHFPSSQTNYAGGNTGLQWLRIGGVPKWAMIFIPPVQLLLLPRVFCFRALLPSGRDMDGEQSCGRRSGESVLRTLGSGCSLASVGRRRESRVSPAAATDAAVGGSSRTDLGAGQVVGRRERDEWADVERLPGEERAEPLSEPRKSSRPKKPRQF